MSYMGLFIVGIIAGVFVSWSLTDVLYRLRLARSRKRKDEAEYNLNQMRTYFEHQMTSMRLKEHDWATVEKCASAGDEMAKAALRSYFRMLVIKYGPPSEVTLQMRFDEMKADKKLREELEKDEDERAKKSLGML